MSACAGLHRVVVNGLSAAEFVAAAPSPDATDLLYVGELRDAKGVDTLLEALALVARETGRRRAPTLVGSGPDRDALVAQAARLGLAGAGALSRARCRSRQAFTLGRMMVAPSRAESMPYIVLETVAAQAPLLATHVGGVPEIFGPFADRLGPPDDPADLARRIVARTGARPERARARARANSPAYVRSRFSLDNMADTVLSAYREALAARRRPRSGAPGAAAHLVNEA